MIEEDQLDTILDVFNTTHPTIKFTMEREQHGGIPVLDLFLRRENTTITTDWYSKPIASGRLLNYLSAHPPAMKYNVGLAFTNRVINLSHPKYRHKVFKKAEVQLRKNNYPPHVVKKIIKFVKYGGNRTTNETNIPQASPENFDYRSFPYIPGLTNRLEQHIQAVKPELRLGKQPINKNQSSFSNMKAKIEKPIENVVYKLECGDCDKVYIGETKREARVRIHEHELELKREHKKVEAERQRLMRIKLPLATERITRHQACVSQEVEKDIKAYIAHQNFKTAALEHQLRNSHQFKFNEFQVLESNLTRPKRQLLESIHIHMAGNAAVNFKTDTHALHPTTKLITNYYQHTRYKHTHR
jgi:hypothetical protein